MKKLYIIISSEEEDDNSIIARHGTDEIYVNPEYNRHPRDIVLFTQDIIDKINAGKQIEITTYSDYIIKELNLSIMRYYAKNVEEPYASVRSINPDLIECWDSKPLGGFVKCDISELGIEVKSMDDVINKMNDTQDYLLYHEYVS